MRIPFRRCANFSAREKGGLAGSNLDSGRFLEALGTILDRLGALWGPLGGVLEGFREALGSTLKQFCGFWKPFWSLVRGFREIC